MSSTENQSADVPFEQSLSALEEIVHALEGGQLPLSAALARYEEAIGHLKRCQQVLETAERKVELLTGVTADGAPVTAPFDDEATSVDERTDRRTRRRGS